MQLCNKLSSTERSDCVLPGTMDGRCGSELSGKFNVAAISPSADQCQNGVGCWGVSRIDEMLVLFYAARPRRTHQLVAANISNTIVVGSGMFAIEVALEPLPSVSPKLDFQKA